MTTMVKFFQVENNQEIKHKKTKWLYDRNIKPSSYKEGDLVLKNVGTFNPGLSKIPTRRFGGPRANCYGNWSLLKTHSILSKKELMRTACGHLFCAENIFRWTVEVPEYPTCEAPIEYEEIDQIFY
ncbi:hypothetical protein BpHYR1_029586 [Brachionus plicatilis]|uniref:Uncharacterized protein n=1 Tax=Brachionus plicatilis TaxID=10195 RepID=A0A3M7SKR0_BRAPC|nr:hypothetical protein BpHYR1_029586 [Brachionus plicatilis]